MKDYYKKSVFRYLIGIIIISFLVVLPFWIYGTPKNRDSLQHFVFADSVFQSLSNGNLYIQGEPAANQGYGGVALRFYPPLTYYLLSLTHLITHDWFNASIIFFWLWMIISGIGAYLLARQWLSENASFLAAILYVIDPYRSSQIQLTGAFAEFVAGGLLTFCFLFAVRIMRGGKLFDIAGLSISFGLLLLTHIPLTIIGSFCLLLFCLGNLNRRNWKDSVLKLSLSVLAGALAASFQLVRIITEMKWINHSDPKYLTEGFYDFKNSFVDTHGTLFPGDLIILCLIILVVPSVLLALKLNLPTRRKLIPMIFVTFFSVFMTTSYSQIIWENIPILQKTQFPWRWMTVSSIGGAILIAVGIDGLKIILKDRTSILWLWVTVSVLATGFFTGFYVIGSNLIDQEYFLESKESFESKVVQQSTAPYGIFWQTIWTKNTAFEIKDKVQTGAEDRQIEILKWDGFDKKFKVSSGNALQARIAQFYYPYWQAKVNGIIVPVSKNDDGVILVSLPNEAATVEISFIEPFIVKFFITLSGIAWIILFGVFLVSLLKQFTPYPKTFKEIRGK